MRVVHLTFTCADGGIGPAEQLERWPVLSPFLAMLRDAGLDVTALGAAVRDGEAGAGPGRVRFVGDGSAARVLRRPARLLAAVREARADVVHVQGLVFPAQTWWLSRTVRGVPIVVQERSGVPPGRRWRRAAYRHGLAPVAGAVFTARAQFQEWVAAGVLRADLPVLEAAGGTCGFAPGDRAEARRASGLSGNPCVVWVGHLIRRKDPIAALAGFARARAILPEARLHMVYADDTLLDLVQERVRSDPRLAGHVELVGRLPHERLEKVYRAADIFLLPSRHEGANLATMESLACGTPAAVTDLPVFRAVAGDAAEYFAAGDADGVAAALVRLVRDGSVRRDAARRRFETHLSSTVVGQRLALFYAGLQA